MQAVRAEERTRRRASGDYGRDLRSLFRQLPGAAWITDRELRVIDIIGYVEGNLGKSHDQLLGLHVSEIAETREPTDAATAAHVAALSGSSSSFRYQLHEHWYEVHVEPLRDADRIVGCIGVGVDITKRVALEQRAAASEARAAEHLHRSVSLLEATIESTADGILVVDLKGKVVAINKRFLALWKVPPDMASRGDEAELLNYVLDQLQEPDEFLARVRALYTTPDHEDFDVIEFKDGRVFERYSRPQCIDDEIVGRVWSFRDVTVRQRLLRQAVTLADASRLLGSLDAAAALESVARLLVRDGFEACVFDLFDETTLRRRVVVANEASSGQLHELPVVVGTLHAEVHELGERAVIRVPLTAAGRVGGWLAAIGASRRAEPERDVELLEEIGRRCAVALENSRMYQRAQEDIQAREEFLSVASHELRGPIAAIRFAVEGLRSGGPKTEQLVGIIDREEHRLERLVDELLDLGRLQSGHLHLLLEPVDLGDVVRDAATRVTTDLARSGSSLTIHGERSVSGRWDRVRLEQIVANLISNAIKFGNGKPIEIELARRGDRAVLTVTDHGIGIPEHKLATIFEPFERAVPARHYGGLGLGLYIVRAIVTRFGGLIGVRSAGAWTAFTVELPLEVDA